MRGGSNGRLASDLMRWIRRILLTTARNLEDFGDQNSEETNERMNTICILYI
jgi:hypothetical protein